MHISYQPLWNTLKERGMRKEAVSYTHLEGGFKKLKMKREEGE